MLEENDLDEDHLEESLYRTPLSLFTGDSDLFLDQANFPQGSAQTLDANDSQSDILESRPQWADISQNATLQDPMDSVWNHRHKRVNSKGKQQNPQILQQIAQVVARSVTQVLNMFNHLKQQNWPLYGQYNSQNQIAFVNKTNKE